HGYRRFSGPVVLGGWAGGGARCRTSPAACHDPRRLHHLPGRDLPGAAQLGREGLSQPGLLQRSRPRRPLRGLGGAGAVRERAPGRVQVSTSRREFVMSTTVDTATDIRPFHAEVPQKELDDLRTRLAMTRWPDRETVADASQGAPLARLQELVRYWATEYDWRTAEAKLNALPQFVTKIDGVDVHFIHVRSRHEEALPMIVTHGWPGSVMERLRVIEPLTDPTANGGTAEDAFHVVIPSLPGYGFSGHPEAAGWDPDRIAHAWDELMRRLGYGHYVA